MAHAVVVGGGLGAVRAAAVLVAAGRPVTLLQVGPHLAGLAHPEVPVGTGFERHSAAPSGWRELRGVTTGLYVGGAVHALPLSRAVLPSLIPAAQLGAAVSAWGRTRAAGELARLIGGGHEQRTYKDWVVQQYGEPIYGRLFRPYCERRFGNPDGVTATVARAVHGPAVAVPRVCPVAGRAAELAGLAQGVDVRLGVQVTAIEAGCVRTAGGEVRGDVYVDLPPARVVELLGAAAPAGLAAEVAWLRFRHALEVTLPGGAALPWITHVVDGPGQAFRFVRHGFLPGTGELQGHVSVQMAVEDADPLWAASDAEVVDSAAAALAEIAPDVRTDGARVQRVADHHPVWVYTTAARMRRYELALGELGVVPVGRAGTYAPLSGEAERAYLADAVGAGVPLREAMRRHVDPPVRTTDDRPQLTDFANA